MAVSVDTVYQKVLAFANKEQRGYITPQEFNLFADQAQMEIFEQYFYDINQFGRVPGNEHQYADMKTNLQQKIDIFNRILWGPNKYADPDDQYGNLRLHNYAPDLYRLGVVKMTHNFGGNKGRQTRVIEYIRESDRMLYTGPLTRPTYERPIYISYDQVDGGHTPTPNLISPSRITIFPSPNYYIGAPKLDTYSDRNSFAYTRKPVTPNWGYVVVNDKPLYNSNTSTDFELHAAEESELVYRILTFTGIAIEKPQLSQMAGGLGGTQIQQEKQ